MRDAATSHRNDALAIELILELLAIFPGEEALGGPWQVQYGVHVTIIAKADASGRP
jgi:hypothetical protein